MYSINSHHMINFSYGLCSQLQGKTASKYKIHMISYDLNDHGKKFQVKDVEYNPKEPIQITDTIQSTAII